MLVHRCVSNTAKIAKKTNLAKKGTNLNILAYITNINAADITKGI